MNILWWFLYGNMLNEMEVSTMVVTPTEYLIIKIAMILGVLIIIGVLITLEILVRRYKHA